ncbi:conjugal transfer protein TraG N-terminal domain-containing protein [Diaphorobacter sp. J5-51]|uniref:conjugal transfer protein TraG N-terminal domain-containing protein n=1 Tax=Diaphorobacter sp. J5-51 TaxID=680496 RepID=UPI0009FD0B37|nr:conjugal transfer protein TraG N-terminal domain-containing protein [Diaphorobacter sp. J5-51]
MAFTIYTVSDPAIVGSVMTSMAMFFGQDSWVGTSVKMGLIISLLTILAKGVLAKEGLRLDVLLLQLIVVWVMFIPKTTVTIEQFENNAPVRMVDDVPYAIALPGAVAGSFALFMTNKIETVMSGVDGKYITASGEIDPFAPAKALMRIATSPMDPARHMDINLIQTLHNAAKVCGGKDTASIRFEKEKDGFAKFANSLTEPGVVTVYNESYPFRDSGGGGEYVTCDVAKAEIAAVGAQLKMNNLGSFQKTMNGIAETTMGSRYSDNSSSAPNSNQWGDLLPILNRVAPAKAQLDSLAVANIMSYTVLSQTARNAKKTAIDEVLEIQRDAGLFQWAKDESMQAMMVSTTAPKFMDILFFIFIAATPIVMFVVVANPASGIKVAGAYVLFGLWTQSWIPMMAIISGWYQAEIKNFASPGMDGLTPEYLSALMRHVSTSTIAASNMLQSAPYMMFAIMTGSMFAMSSMVSKAAPSAAAMGGGAAGGGGGNKAGMLGGGLIGNDINPTAQMQQLRQAAAMANGSGGLRGVNPGGDAGAVNPGLATMSTGGDVMSSANATQEKSATARKSLDMQWAEAMKNSAALARSSSSFVSGQQLASEMQKVDSSVKYNSAANTVSGNGWSFDMKDGFAAASIASFGGDAGAGISTPGGKGTIAKALLGISAALQKIANDQVALARGMTQSGGTQVSSGGGIDGGNEQSAGQGIDGRKGSEFKRSAQAAEELAKTAQRIAGQSESLDQADKLTNSASSSWKGGASSEFKGGDVANRWAAMNNTPLGNSQEALQKVIGAIGGELGQRLSGQIAANQEKLRNQKSGLTEDQIAAVAAWQAMDAMRHSGKPGDNMQGLLGMAKFAAAAGFNDVSPALAQVAKAEGLVNDVNKNIKDMEDKVAPQVAAAVAIAEKKLSPEEQKQHDKAVEASLAKDKGEAEKIYNHAQGGTTRVAAEGQRRKEAQDAIFLEQDRQNKDIGAMVQAAAAAREQRNTLGGSIAAWAERNGMSVDDAKKYVEAGKADGNDRKQIRQDVAKQAAAEKQYEKARASIGMKIDESNKWRAANGVALIDKDAVMARIGGGKSGGAPDSKPTGNASEGTPKPVPSPAPSPSSPTPAPPPSAGIKAAAAVTSVLGGATAVGKHAATVVNGAPAAVGNGGNGVTPGSATIGDTQRLNLQKENNGGSVQQPVVPQGTVKKPNAASSDSGGKPGAKGQPVQKRQN